jgi:hypothetical protein
MSTSFMTGNFYPVDRYDSVRGTYAVDGYIEGHSEGHKLVLDPQTWRRGGPKAWIPAAAPGPGGRFLSTKRDMWATFQL